MPLVHCPDCDVPVSPEAVACPKCGCPIRGNARLATPKPSHRNAILTAVACGIGAITCWAILSQQPAAAPPGRTATPASAPAAIDLGQLRQVIDAALGPARTTGVSSVQFDPDSADLCIQFIAQQAGQPMPKRSALSEECGRLLRLSGNLQPPWKTVRICVYGFNAEHDDTDRCLLDARWNRDALPDDLSMQQALDWTQTLTAADDLK